jgi:DNA mismatch repair ATPase MutS
MEQPRGMSAAFGKAVIPPVNSVCLSAPTQSLYKEAAESATQALSDSPDNQKALQRRATANEKLDTWSSLTTALEDYNHLAKLSSTPKASLPGIRQAQKTIPKRIEERKTEETKEMMDKLKGLGNSFLGE